MKISFLTKAILLLFVMNSCSSSQKSTETINQAPADSFLPGLLGQYPQLFDSIIAKKNDYGIQIIYTQIDRNRKGKPRLTDHYFNVNGENYFYPASTVKFPVAVLALQKLNELKIAGLDKNTTMITEADGPIQTEVCNDPSAADGRPTIAHYIKKILLVSDNDAFNRLYEFLGQEYINNTLHKMGFTDVQIIHRLDIRLADEHNRHTNPVKFIDTSGKVIYERPAEKSQLRYIYRDSNSPNYRRGKGYMKGDQLINEPFDFSVKNQLSLQSLHSIMQSILFPEAMAAHQRFHLTDADYAFLRHYMSMRPLESENPVYTLPDYWDNFVKFIYHGAEKTTPDTNIRIFNKTGTAYGFLIDASYVADFKNNSEFMVSAVIYCNSDSIFNDDKYDYDQLGYPFFKNLGRILHEYELKRQKKYIPDLSSFRFEY